MRSIETAFRSMFAQHGKRRILASGATLLASIELIEDLANKYLDQALEAVCKVSKEEEAFVLVANHFSAILRTLEGQNARAARQACGGPSRPPNPDILSASEAKFLKAQDMLLQRLEIERIDFIEQEAPDEKTPSATIKVKSAGGKPLAKHWDAMWAEIATNLWNGDLKPESQADIKRAMFDWLSSNGIDAGETAVAERARALWQRMEADD